MILLGLPAHVDLGAPFFCLELQEILPRDGRALLEVGLGKVFDQTVELLSGLGAPADVHQEPHNALALLHVFLLDPAQEVHHRLARDLVDLDLADPEAVDPSKLWRCAGRSR